MPTFGKEEHLTSQRHISVLQKDGNFFYNFPLRIKWIEVPDNDNIVIKILPTVPKRNFKKAIERNRIKRLIRESYRLQKEIILSVAKQKNKSIIIMFFFTGKKIVTFKEMESKIGVILQHIADNL